MNRPTDIEGGDWKVTGRTATRDVIEWTLVLGDDTYTVERGICLGHDGCVWRAYIDGDPIGPPYDDPEDAMGEAEKLMAKRSLR